MNRLLAALIGVLVLASAWYAWNRLPVAMDVDSSDEPARRGELSRRNVYFGSRNCIAVLPFVDDSGTDRRQFLAQGFSGELISQLTYSPEIRVTARNSSFFFIEGGKPAVIAERLQCVNLLTGEIQTDEGRIAVNVRLTDVRANKELWSGSYERDLSGVFATLDELSAGILTALGVTDPGAVPAATRVDPRAWKFYLEGSRYLDHPVGENSANAIEYFEKALAIEPDYEAALLGKAEAWLIHHSKRPGQVGSGDRAREAVAKAVMIKPESARAYGILSFIRRNLDWDWTAAHDAARRAIELKPGDAELMSLASLSKFTLGQFAEAEELLQAAIKRDPLNLALHLRLGLLLEFAGKYEQSLARYRQIIVMNPEYPGLRAYRARVKILQGKPDSALKESELEIHPFWKTYSSILALSALERRQEALTLLDRLVDENGVEAAFQIAEIRAFTGEIDQAFVWLQRAHDQRDGGMAEIVGNRFFDNLQPDPRWRELLEGLGLPLDAITHSD